MCRRLSATAVGARIPAGASAINMRGRCGASAAASLKMEISNEARMICPVEGVRRIASSTGATGTSFLISICSTAHSRVAARASASVGMGSPCIRNSMISDNVKSAMRPCAPVSRVSVESWKTTATPSRVTCTSSSIPSAPTASARSKARRVFSGASADAPRWAMQQGVIGEKSMFCSRRSNVAIPTLRSTPVPDNAVVQIRVFSCEQ